MHLSDLNWPVVQALSKDTPVVFPVAALEQHSQHLPLFTDSLLLGEIMRRMQDVFQDRILFAPLFWLGNSDHHLDFAGTLSAEPRVYLDVLGGLLENFLQHGFRRLVFINGHGGNDVPGRQAVFEIRQRHRNQGDLLLLFATYWQLSATPRPKAADFLQSEMGHACEWETSMMLRLAPNLVGEYQALEPVLAGNAFLPATRGWVTKDRTKPGHIGSPHAATAEKGEALFQTFSEDTRAFLERVLRWDGASWEG